MIVRPARTTPAPVTVPLNRGFVNAKIAEIEAETGIPVRNVEVTLEHVGKQLRFTTEQQTTILNQLHRR